MRVRHQAKAAMQERFSGIWRRDSLLRGFFVSVGGIVFMFCCLTILTLSSCSFG
jgi:hypothetical protein